MTLKEFAQAGGKARQKGLTAGERSELGRKAARARWSSPKKVSDLKEPEAQKITPKLSD